MKVVNSLGATAYCYRNKVGITKITPIYNWASRPVDARVMKFEPGVIKDNWGIQKSDYGKLFGLTVVTWHNVSERDSW